MNLKSKSVFKNFSAVFLLFIVAIAVCVPLKEVNAATSIGELFSFDFFSIITEYIASAMIDENSFFFPIYFLAYHFFNLCLMAVTILVYFGAWLIDVFLDEAIYTTVLNMNDPASAVSIGWTVVRDACNTFFILFLLLIAFSTILRIQTYSAKSLLPKLIISLFLINFSAVIAMMVIDLGQVFMFEIKSWMGPAGFSGSGGGGSPLTTIVDYFNNNYDWHGVLDKKERGNYNFENVVGVGFAAAYSLILGLLYIMLALFLMVRIVVFVILVIISPFAFFSIILPGMRTYTSQWWQSLVSHAIFGPVFLFFIFLSGKMAQSMETTFVTPATTDEISSLSFIIAKLIPHVVALGMLAAAIPATQKLGAAGASKFIGGTAGLGKIGIGAVAGAKLAGGLGKKTGGETFGRAHSAMKGGSGKFSKKYNDLANWTGGKLKSSPIGGRIFVKHEADKAVKNKEAVSKHEKIMDNLTDTDKKKYVDSFKIDKNAQAEAQQAMFNLMAKDSGKGLTNKRLRKMGYEKEMDGKKVFDEERFNKDYGRAAAHGMDTTNIETYRPDLIIDKDTKLDRVRKTVADGDEKKIKLDALADEDIEKELKESMDKQRYHSFISSKPQEERDGLVEIKKQQLASMYDSDGSVREGRKDETLEQRREIFNLSGSKDKLNALKGVKIEDGEVKLTGPINIEFARSAVEGMNADELVNQDPEFLEETGHMIDPLQIGRIKRNKYTTPEQTKAIEKSVRARMKKDEVDEAEYEKLKKSLNALESSITRPSPDKKSDGRDGGGNDQSTFDNFKGGPRQSSMDDFESSGEGGAGGSGGASNPKPNKSSRSLWKDESASVGLTGSSKSDVQKLPRRKVFDKEANTSSKSIGSIKNISGHPSVKKSGNIEKEKKSIGISFSEDNAKTPPISGDKIRKNMKKQKQATIGMLKGPGKDSVATDKAMLKVLKVGSKIDKKIAKVKPFVEPALKKQLEIDERRQSGEEISQRQEDEEKLEALKGVIKKKK